MDISSDSSDDSKVDIPPIVSIVPNRDNSEMDQLDSMSDGSDPETVDVEFVDDEKEDGDDFEDLEDSPQSVQSVHPFNLVALLRDLSDLMGPESNLMRLILSEYSPLAIVLLLLVLAQLQVPAQQDEIEEEPIRTPCGRVQVQTRITHYFEPTTVVQNEDEEKESEECEAVDGTWNVGIETTAFDFDTNTVYQCHHNIRIDDLFQSDSEEMDTNYAPVQFHHQMPPRVVFIPFQLGPLGSGLSGMPMVSNPMMRILKETMSAGGQHFVRNHGLTAVVMSFVGIAASLRREADSMNYCNKLA